MAIEAGAQEAQLAVTADPILGFDVRTTVEEHDRVRGIDAPPLVGATPFPASCSSVIGTT